MDTSSFNILSLCTGGGGLDLGVALAVPNVRIICCVEHEAYCCEVLATRMEDKALDDAPVWTDLRTFDGKPWRGVVDCIIGGYPCQPFSVAGKQLGKRDARHLWPDIARIIGEVQPSMCFFENVAGHLSVGADTVFESLERMGYEIAAGLFTAAEVGASHRRERLFVLADNQAVQRPAIRRREPDGLLSSMGNTSVTERGRTAGRTRPEQTPDAGGADMENTKGGRHIPAAQPEQAAKGRQADEESRIPGELQTGLGRPGRHGELPIFPPNPNDLEAWGKVLKIDPSLEPAICGVADGLAPRVDRLRMLGNGVVPLQAAYAFVSLWAALRGG